MRFLNFLSIASVMSSCVNYTTQGWMNYSKFVNGLPIDNVYSYTPLPGSLTPCDLELLHQSCVDRINGYRAGILKFSNGQSDPGTRNSLVHYTQNNRCSNAISLGDLYVNDGQGLCVGAHTNPFSCPLPPNTVGNRGQNTCCRRVGTTVAAIQATMYDCLQSMWDEGIGQPDNAPWSEAIGHWLNMRSTEVNSVSCSFSFRTDGAVWMNQDFYSGQSPSLPSCNCVNIPAGSSDGCGGICYESVSTPTTAPLPTPLPTPKPTPLPTRLPTSAPLPTPKPTLPPTRAWSTFPCYYFYTIPGTSTQILVPNQCPP